MKPHADRRGMPAALVVAMPTRASATTTFISYALIGSAAAPVQKFAGSAVALLFAVACVIAFGVGTRR
jgi:hypothetical protein